MALELGQVSIPDIERELGSTDRKTAGTAIARLQALGLLKVTDPQPPTHKGRVAQVYVPCSPSPIARNETEKLLRAKPLFDQVDEHLEQLAEIGDKEGALFVLKDHDVGIREMAGIIAGARKTVLVGGRDCSFLEAPEVTAAIKTARRTGATVDVIGSTSQPYMKELEADGVKIFLAPVDLPPIVVVDGTHLVMAYKPNRPSSRYQFATTNNKYLAQKQIGVLNFVKKHSVNSAGNGD